MRSDRWTAVSMQEFTAYDGCSAFRAEMELDDSQIGQTFRWGVSVTSITGTQNWAITTEVNDTESRELTRNFTLTAAGGTQRYFLTHYRRLGANKHHTGATIPAIRFAVWAPNARKVELVRGNTTSGYIDNNGAGVVAVIPMRPEGNGIWSTDVADAPILADFAAFDHTPYMFRIVKDDGTVAYRTDLYSRCQIGSGKVDPEVSPGEWSGRRQDLDGTKSCSVVVDPERVARLFRECQLDGQAIECTFGGDPVWPETQWETDNAFWECEFSADHPLPTRLEDLVIYELHIDGLGAANDTRGTIDDALDHLDYLQDLGINAIELMPLAEYEGWSSWGYGTSHYMAIEYAGGGRDQFKHFVRACHRRGIAVILDVVYNHFTHDGERAEWAYDSDYPQANIYYWYEGTPDSYRQADGGYIDNMSTGYAPRYWEENVRKMFISSAAALLTEFHVDGFRVDQTTSIHSYAVLHADGRPADNARIFGAKFLREWCRTLRLLKPNVFLMAEDHSGWTAVTQPLADGGMGFDATWYADFYHHLIGDAQNNPQHARLLKEAGYGDDRPLNFAAFADALSATAGGRVIYHESHDEAGNSYYYEGGHRVNSARTIVTAVNSAPLDIETRYYAEARTRFVAGITLLSPGTPMFFMGEEVGASRPYRYNDFLANREDFQALRVGSGAKLFRYYQALIRLRTAHPSFKSGVCEVVHFDNDNRVIAFRRFTDSEEFLVVGSLNNRSFPRGYRIRHPSLADGQWQEFLNSDANQYGGGGSQNDGLVTSNAREVVITLEPNNLVVLKRK